MSTARKDLILSVRIEPAVLAALQNAAAADGRSVSGLAHKILAEWLRRTGLREPRPRPWIGKL
jgi:hypothetical protein